ncbi:RNA polymerase sigma factor [Pelobacter propionicus]|uniref:Sigma-70, region 4 type 2 n=1 Tax=Pelobacter propionicus (strain DSM 2379 / NBRC 103807 / OttBd1) TaxID=338966 RepID=A1AKD1_PELPD|nr:DNA-directed RNA polymerase sigma-70 factor [Pelobacter propionicus]ABK97801.1 Sigma-70, region 4 type 2 [Pelobacter propionicus DSM 2379]
MTSEFNDWLHSKTCLDLLLSCADYIIGRAKKSTIQLDTLFSEETEDDHTKLSQVVASHLWEFLKDKNVTLATLAAERVAQGDVSGFMTLVADRFLAECLDERRTAAINPAYAYYRHLRHVISKAEEVNYQPTRRGSFYAFSFADSLQRLPEVHWNLSYTDWPRPAVPAAHIHDKPGIMRLSRNYWDEAVVRFLDEYFLPIRELNRYVSGNYSLGCAVTTESQLTMPACEDGSQPFSFDEILVTDAQNDVLGSMGRQHPRLDCDIIETELEALAHDTLSELTERQRTILLRVEDGATLDEIARELGERGASNIHYHLKKAYQTMKRKWSLWGPPTLAQFSEVEEEEFFIFYDKVIELCKICGECRTTTERSRLHEYHNRRYAVEAGLADGF